MRDAQPGRLRRERWLILAVLLLAYALRAVGVDHQPLRGDEAFSAGYAARPVADMLAGMAQFDPNPPLYLLLLKGWIMAAGDSELALRWPSVLGALAAAALTYRLGREMAGRAAGALAAFFVAINPFLVWYGQDARVYALLVALTTGALWFTWRGARHNRARDWLAAGALWWLSLFAHYFALFPLAAAGLAVVAAPQSRARWLAAAGMAAGVGLAFLPWAWYVAPFLAGHSKSWIPAAGLADAAWRTLTVFSAGMPSAGGAGWLGWLGGALLLLLLLMGAAVVFRRDRGAALWLLLLGPGVPLMLWAVSLIRPALTEQYVIGSLPFVWLLAAAAMTALPRLLPEPRAARWLGRLAAAVCALLAVLSLGNYYFDPAYAKSPNWRGVAAYLAETARADEVVVLNLPDPAFYYYYDGPMPVEASPPGPLADVGTAAAETQLRQLQAGYRHIRLFFSPSPAYDPEGLVGRWFEACCEKTADAFHYGFRVQTYDTPEASLAARRPHAVDFENGVALTGYRVLQTEVRAGEPLRLTLYWRAQAAVESSYMVFVHLLALDGGEVIDADSWPADGQHPTDSWVAGEMVIDPHTIPIPAFARAGTYLVRVGLFKPPGGERVWAVGPDGDRAQYAQLPVTVEVKNSP